MEHFDERLDLYLEKHQVGNFLPQYVGYAQESSEVPAHIFQGFYVRDLLFVLLGEGYEIAPVVNEIKRLHNALLECARYGDRLPYKRDVAKEQ